MAETRRLIDWRAFAPRDTASKITVDARDVLVFGCHDRRQAVIWLVRGTGSKNPRGMLPARPPLCDVRLRSLG